MSTLPHELRYLARRELCLVLDCESTQGKDWRGLVDRMNFSNDMIRRLRNKSSPTEALLEEWETTKGKEANLATLITLLESLGCSEAVDVLKNPQVNRSIDIPKSKKHPRATKDELTASQSPNPHHPLTPCNSIDPSKITPEEIERIRRGQQTDVDPQQLVKTLRDIAINGHSSSGEASSQVSHKEVEEKKEFVRSQRFDIFLSFATQDQLFAEEVRDRLVNHANVSVFVPVEGLMPGKVFHEEIADMIKEGSRKTIVILSPNYLKSQWCKYEANVAFMKSPDTSVHSLIPVMYKKCEVPAFLGTLQYLDYPRYKDNPKDCENYFWKRLYSAVTYTRPAKREP